MVKLLPLLSTDLEDLLEMYNDNEIHSQSILGYFLPVNDLKLKNAYEQWFNDKEQMHYKIVVSNDTVVGYAQIYDINSVNRKCTLGIKLKQHYQGKGIGKSALRKLIDVCFNHINLHKIEISIVKYNNKSINLFTSMGFVKEGILRQSVYKNGGYHDTCQYGLLKVEETTEK